jgi:hypothetical protein
MEEEAGLGSFSYHYIKALQQYEHNIAEADSLFFH